MNGYETWATMLEGGNAAFHEGDPQPGFYKMKHYGEWHPVAIWMESGRLLCSILLGKDVSSMDPYRNWVNFCGNPIPESEYRYYEQHGKWKAEPEPLPSQTQGSNRPSDLYESLMLDANEIIERFDAIGEIKDKDDADYIANTLTKAREIASCLSDMHKNAKAPHLTEGRAVDAKYKEPIAELRERMKMICHKLGEYQEVSGHHKLGGLHGRQIGSKVERLAVIEDIDKVVQHFAGTREMRELARKLAQRMVKAGGEVPGVSVTERRIAV